MSLSWFVGKLCDSVAYKNILFQEAPDLDEHLRTEQTGINNEACSTIENNENDNNVCNERSSIVQLETFDTRNFNTPIIGSLDESRPIVNPIDSSQDMFIAQDDEIDIAYEKVKCSPSSFGSPKNVINDKNLKQVTPEQCEIIYQKDEAKATSSSHPKNSDNNNFESQQNEIVHEEYKTILSSPCIFTETKKLENQTYYTCAICKETYTYFNPYWRHIKSHSHESNHSVDNNNTNDRNATKNNLPFMGVGFEKLNLRQFIGQKTPEERNTVVNPSELDEIMILYQNNHDEPSKYSINNSNHFLTQENQLPSAYEDSNKDNLKIQTTDEEIIIISPNPSPTTNKMENRFNCDQCKLEFLYFNPFWRHLKSHNLNNSGEDAEQRNIVSNDSDFAARNDPVTTQVQLEKKSSSPKTKSLEIQQNVHISMIKLNDRRIRKIQQLKASNAQQSSLNYTRTPRKTRISKTMIPYKSSRPNQRIKHHTCPICQKTYKSIPGLINHKSGTHSIIPPYSCKHCQEKFSRQQSLVIHVRTVHNSNDYYISCEKCGKKLVRSTAMKRHKRYCIVKQSGIHRKLDMNSKESSFINNGKIFGAEVRLRDYKVSFDQQSAQSSNHVCNICGKTFKSWLSWESHKRLHKDNKIHKCQYCESLFTSHSGLVSHIHLEHQINEPCGELETGFTNEGRVDFPELTGRSLTLPVKTPKGRSSCKVCGKKFKSPAYLRNHLKRKLACDLGWNKLKIIAGPKIKTGNTSNACKNELILQAHAQKEFSCEFCLRTFGYARVLANHRKSHLKKNVNSNISARNPKSTRNTNPGTQMFSKADNDNCTTILPKTYERKTRFSCSYCRQQFSSRVSLINHTRLHTGHTPFGCKYCDNKYSSKGAALVHTKIKHPRPFPCVLCKNAFKTFDNLVKHNIKYHTEEKIVSSSSSKEFIINKTTLVNGNKINKRKYHWQQSTFDNKKLHMCAYCPKKLTTVTGLKFHTMIHTGERPYACPYCEKSFIVSRCLEDHVRLHTGQKPYKCKICGKAYASRRAEWSHKTTKHTKRHTGENL